MSLREEKVMLKGQIEFLEKKLKEPMYQIAKPTTIGAMASIIVGLVEQRIKDIDLQLEKKVTLNHLDKIIEQTERQIDSLVKLLEQMPPIGKGKDEG